MFVVWKVVALEIVNLMRDRVRRWRQWVENVAAGLLVVSRVSLYLLFAEFRHVAGRWSRRSRMPSHHRQVDVRSQGRVVEYALSWDPPDRDPQNPIFNFLDRFFRLLVFVIPLDESRLFAMAMRVVMAPSLFASVVSSSSLRRLSSLSLQDTSFTLGGCRSADSSNKEDAGSAHAKGEEEELVPWFDALVSAGTLRACEPQRRALTSLTSLREDVLRHANSLKQYTEQKESHAKKRLEILEKLEQEARRKQEQLEQQQAHSPDTSSSNQQKWFTTMPFAFALARRRERTEQQVLEQSKKAAKERAAEADRIVGPPPARPTPPLGLYLHGDVGAGKSLALDMFAASLPKSTVMTRRLHFHAAMLEISHRLHANRTAAAAAAASCEGVQEDPDSVRKAAKSAILALRRRKMLADRRHASSAEGEEHDFGEEQGVADEMRRVALEMLGVDGSRPLYVPVVVCLDEMQVPDAFACVALRALIATLRDVDGGAGAVVVLTSNSAPEHLNRAGVAPESFAALLRTLRASSAVYELVSGVDHRQEAAKGLSFTSGNNRRYLINGALREAFDEHCSMHGGGSIAPHSLSVLFNRTLHVSCAHASSRSAYFTFNELCALPLGPADYHAIASTYEHVFIDHVPKMDASQASEARRFITLVDELYNFRCLVSISAAAPPSDLFASDVSKIDASEFAESTQFETSAGSSDVRLRRDVTQVAGTVDSDRQSLSALVSGSQERFAFIRAVSRLAELASPSYENSQRGRWRGMT